MDINCVQQAGRSARPKGFTVKNVFERSCTLLASLALLLGAIAYHLWRVATLRADFARLADAASGAIAFGSLALIAAICRWHLANDQTLGRAMLIGVGTLVLYVALFDRSRRSSSLVYAAWMASAIVDLGMTALWAVGAIEQGTSAKNVASVVELALVAAAAWRFSREPADVRARGYRRTTAASDQD